MSQEQHSREGTGLRYNEGKNRLDLIPAWALERLGEVFTRGAQKYAEDNWRKGMSWKKVLASLERHVLEFKKGHDYDEETALMHTAQIAWNAMVLTEYYKIHQHGDDRELRIPLAIGLDVDGVLADFYSGYRDFCNNNGCSLDEKPAFWNHWDGGSFDKIAYDPEFWMNLDPLVESSEIPFEPVAYITHRFVDCTADWLEKHRFPSAKVHTVLPSVSKVETLKLHPEIEIFVDDKIQNFLEINRAQKKGKINTVCFLWETTQNQKFDVGYRRVKSFDELLDKI